LLLLFFIFYFIFVKCICKPIFFLVCMLTGRRLGKSPSGKEMMANSGGQWSKLLSGVGDDTTSLEESQKELEEN
jgi:hypothetical protein